MKRINYAGGSIITGSAVAAALLAYVTSVAGNASSVAVDIPVFEPNGEITFHTLLLGPAAQFDISDVDGLSGDEEARQFPVPTLPPTGDIAVSGPSADADRFAKAFDRAVAAVEESHNGF